jgi:replicative DNA helicase
MVNKVPPYNMDAEVSTLGSIMIDKDAMGKILDIIKPEDFYKEAHGIIYEAILGLYERGEPVDMVTVTEELSSRGALEKSGGVAYITSLANAVPTAANVEYYAKIVEEKATFRSLISAGTKIATLGYQGEGDVDVALDQAEQEIFRIGQRQRSQGYVGIRDVLVHTFEHIEKVYNSQGGITGIPTGFRDLDQMLSGLQPSDLIIIAGRPSMGKTSLALNIAQHVAIDEKIPVAIFSLEMPKEQLAIKMLCSEGKVNSQRLRTGSLTDEDWPKLSYALAKLSEAPIYIDDTPAISSMELRTRARRIKAEHDLGLIVIDYLQLVQGRARNENRQQEIAEITRSLKSLARELNVPVVALAQLSRAVEMTSDCRPRLSHLKESGELEQSADVVAFIYREEYYNPDTERKNMAEIIIAKQRNGPTGTVELFWHRDYTTFTGMEKYRKAE